MKINGIWPPPGYRCRYVAMIAYIHIAPFVVSLAVVIGCTQERRQVQLTTNESVDPLGVEIVADAAIAPAKESHSENSPYRDAYNSPETYNAWSNDKNGGGAYGSLNDRLHDSIRNVLRQHFRDSPLPSGYDHSRGNATTPDNRYLAFAYHNWDWFDPTRQVHVQIVANQVTRDLLARLQSLLAGEFADWCIVLLASTDRNFDNKYELLVFSNSVKVSSSFMAESAN